MLVHEKIMKFSKKTFLLFLFIFIIGCTPLVTAETNPAPEQTALPTQTATLTNVDSLSEESTTLQQSPTRVKPTLTPPPTPTPDPYSALYGCQMEIRFATGPLSDKSSNFNVLDRDYFYDKGDKFAPGKGTAIFYEAQRYFILHSAYVKGNVLRPMEAEFLRKYLEYWGTTGTEYIEGQIDSLIGSQVVWVCNEETVFETEIIGITRLSHEASNRLWLEPENIVDIIRDKEGLVSEWIGELQDTDQPTFYVGFCGWGPQSLDQDRYTYYRYLIQLEVMP